MPCVLILADSDDLADLQSLPFVGYDLVVLAFWAPPEYAARVIAAGATDCLRLNDLITDYAALIRRGYALVHSLVQRAPCYRAVNPLQAWENVIATALSIPLVMSALHRALAARSGDAIDITFLTHNDSQRAFETINTAPTYIINVLNDIATTKLHAPHGRLAAWFALIAEARRDGDWQNILAVPIETVDARYKWRSRGPHRQSASRSDTLFYSSYINFSSALARHAQSQSEPVQWVVNTHSARRGLPAGVRAANLWDFGTPDSAAHRAWLSKATALFSHAPELADNFPLRAALDASIEVQETLSGVMPLLLAEIDLMYACLQALKPTSVWVANQWGGEGCVLQVAQALGIPVTQVQHGTLEQYYSCAPIYTGRFLVWDEFWKQLVTPDEQTKVQVVASADVTPYAQVKTPPYRHLTFLTGAPPVSSLWNTAAADWETVYLLHTLLDMGYRVTLRAHPMDSLERYAQVWNSQYGALPAALELNKGTPLAPLLARTDAALMAFSTVMLECRAQGVPVFGLGWYGFMFKQAVETAGYIAYSDSLTELLAHFRLAVQN